MVGASSCPLGGQLAPFQLVNLTTWQTRYAFYVALVIVILFTIAAALLLLGLTIATFNRSMGRMPERARRVLRPPRRAQTERERHVSATGPGAPILATLKG
jgi:hypothetical protein